ncbi:ABC transporter ATP-binding protein [Chryseobacterium salivictor]|uniref:Teichoic acids export ATP-binding protein TagH n=1 Tax=Chryseobacterium salivictor TaxID=2547600 RepID=A0A4P6ZFF1_9FLAO|nr:ABC transporter ATP-binding protein [Chryseobacterium salivictor]QBO58350.1 Teichoic acids export ATP-binding protein TagH [Chryseobacterium salivictor]
MNPNTAITAHNISKQYRLGEVGTGTLTHDLNRFWAKLRGKEDPFLKIGESNDRTSKGESDYVWSLKDINFEIEKGDAVGIIGRNGAGKSTLLKLLSRVTKPTTGHFEVQGRIASLLEVGTGFNPEMTGRENIFLNGAILGMRRQEIKRKFDEIVDFAGVERYIDTPVKRYSSGMYVRLAFAVAAHLESEILIVDEVLAVGDAEFQKKCLGKMGDVSKGEGRTVLFVSHDLNAVSQLCNVGILLNNGEVEYRGPAREAISKYLSDGVDDAVYINPIDSSSKEIFIKKIEVQKSTGSVSSEFYFDEIINLKFNIEIKNKNKYVSLFVMILDSRKKRIFACETENIKDEIILSFEANTLVRGSYSVHAFINEPKIKQHDVAEDVCKFVVLDASSYLSKHGDYDYGSVFAKHTWK